jgi:hypothetical protein
LSSQLLTPSPSSSRSAQLGAAGAGAAATGRLRAQRDHDADRSQRVAEPALLRRSNALVVEIGAVGDFGANRNALLERGLQADADLGGEIAVLAVSRTSGAIRVFLFGLLVAKPIRM